MKIIKFLLPIVKSPIRLLITSWFLVFFIYVISPIQFEHEWSLRTIIFVSVSFAAFTVGYFCGKSFIENILTLKKVSKTFQENTNKKNTKIKINELNKIVVISTLLGLIGIITLIIDLVYLRNIDFSQGLSAARDFMNQQVIDQGGIPTGHPLSIAARILSGFVPVAGLITVLRLESMANHTVRVVIFATIIQLASETLSGGRNSIFISLLLLICGLIIRARNRKKFKNYAKIIRKMTKWIYISVCAFIPYIFFIFIERESLRERTIVESYINIQNSFLLQFSFDIEGINQYNEDFYILLLPFIYLIIYIIHGINELNLLCSNIDFNHFFYGLHSFLLPALFFNKIGLIEANEISKLYTLIERTGVYKTGLGSLYLDFGYVFSWIIILSSGFIIGFIWKLHTLGYRLYVDILCSYILLTILISPFYLSLNTGNGFQILIASILLSSWTYITRLNY